MTLKNIATFEFKDRDSKRCGRSWFIVRGDDATVGLCITKRYGGDIEAFAPKESIAQLVDALKKALEVGRKSVHIATIEFPDTPSNGTGHFIVRRCDDFVGLRLTLVSKYDNEDLEALVCEEDITKLIDVLDGL